ncbi:MAG: hypothetical protein GKR99_10245 [Rhodobacteraceae bacterium]|nr:hypothetical protein [Paracoccaceae bacterium]
MLKPFLLSTSVFALVGATPVAADGVLSLGLTFAFGAGGGTAASVGVWSNDESGEGAVGLTGNYYFSTNQFGVGANVGVVQDDFIGSVGYDFMQQAPTVGLHVIDGASDPAPMSPQQSPPPSPPSPPTSPIQSPQN